MLLDRLIPGDMRALNLDVIDGPATDDLARVVADAVAAMPFLAERRVVVVRGCERLRAQPRRDLWAVAEAVPAGNTLVLEDLFPPNKKTKPEPFGALAGRKALRIDTTRRPPTCASASCARRSSGSARRPSRARSRRWPRARPISARSPTTSRSSRSRGTTITLADLERESLAIEDPKAWQYASALVEGRTAEALDDRLRLLRERPARGGGAAGRARWRPSSGLIWELARPDGGALAAAPPLARARRCGRSPAGSASGARATASRRPCAASKRW